MAAAPRTRSGLGDLPDKSVALDGRWYRVGKDVSVSLQDARGLINVNDKVQPCWEIWEGIVSKGSLVPTVCSQSASLVDNLLDYRDSDRLKRINGAERAEYAQQGKEVNLRNADLRKRPRELARIKVCQCSFGPSGAGSSEQLYQHAYNSAV